MAGSLRGQLGVKSSPLCPTSSKLCTQYLVLDHMNNHYKKLSKVKPSIDNAPPKSMTKSQKARDRVQREHGSRPSSRYSARPDSRNTARPYSAAESDIYDETYWGDPEDEEETHVLSIMKNMLKKPSAEDGEEAYPRTAMSGNTGGLHHTNCWPQNDGAGATYKQSVRVPRPTSSYSARSAGATFSKPGLQTQPTIKTAEKDILKTRSHAFTEPQKPFTPRTLKSNRSSRLSEYKYYTAPKRRDSVAKKRQDPDVDVVDGPESSMVPEQRPAPRPRQRMSSGNSKLDATQDSENTLTFATLQTRDMSRVQLDKSQVVPPLDISVDKDHMDWLKEQATKAQIRTRKDRTMGSIKEDHQNLDDTAYGSGKRLNDTTYNSGKRLGKSGTLTRSFGSTQSWAQERASAEEEELKYIEFVKDVTKDVLERGIFTNRVLLHAFENHIQKRKHELDERTMRSMLTQLRDELRIPSETEAEHDEDNMGHSSSRSSKSGKKKWERQDKRETRALNFKPSDTSKTFDAPIRDATGTSSWLSTGTGDNTLQYGKFGGTGTLGGSTFAADTLEYDKIPRSGKLPTDMISEEPSLTTTLEQDGDVLSVTQTLKNYELDITQKDSLENHLLHGEANFNGNSVPASESGDHHITEDKVPPLKSPKSDVETPKKVTPSPRPTMRRQTAEESQDSVEGMSDRISQQMQDEDKQSTASRRSEHRKKRNPALDGERAVDRVVSPKEVVSPRSVASGQSSSTNPKIHSGVDGNPDVSADEDYADDYEEDPEDADDEDANTLTTHRTSDEDF